MGRNRALFAFSVFRRQQSIRGALHLLFMLALILLSSPASAENHVASLLPGAAATDTIASGLDFTCAISTDGHDDDWAMG